MTFNLASGSGDICLVNGVPADRISVRDRGLAYGDGLFETIRVARGSLTLAEYHFARLERDAARLHIAMDLPVIAAEANRLAAQLGAGLIKLIVTRGIGERGYAPSAEPVTRILQSFPLPEYPEQNAEEGVRLFRCRTRLALQPALAGIKHLNRLEQVLARAEWQAPFGEGLVCDMRGRPIECTMSNLFVRIRDKWITPELTQCGVRGVMRDYLLNALLSEQVEVRPVEHQELLDSEEVFCCNSVYGVWPVVGFMDKVWSPGPFTRQAQTLAKQALT